MLRALALLAVLVLPSTLALAPPGPVVDAMRQAPYGGLVCERGGLDLASCVAWRATTEGGRVAVAHSSATGLVLTAGYELDGDLLLAVVEARDAQDGSLAWRRVAPVPGDSMWQEMVLSPDGTRAHLAGVRGDGTLGLLGTYRVEDGAQLWLIGTPRTVRSLSADALHVYLSSASFEFGTLQARNATTGAIHRDFVVSKFGAQQTLVAPDGGVVVSALDVGGASTLVYGPGLDTLRWSAARGGNLLSIRSNAIVGGALVAHTQPGALIAYALENGAVLWTAPVPGAAPNVALAGAPDGSTVYVLRASGELDALSMAGGAALWTATSEVTPTGWIAATDDRIVAGGTSGTALQTASGMRISVQGWHRDGTPAFAAADEAPLATPFVLFALADDGRIYAAGDVLEGDATRGAIAAFAPPLIAPSVAG